MAVRQIAYADFDLLLRREENHYRVKVVKAPTGEADGVFELPFNDLQLENFLLKVGQPRRGMRRIDTSQVQATKQFGGQLFQAVFQPEVLATLRSSLDDAARQNQGLRLRLRMNETPELAELPWEYLYNSSLNQFLALAQETPIVRYLELPKTIPSLRVTVPLRLLVVVSSPANVPQLDSLDEWRRLQTALGTLVREGKVVLERLESATLKALQHRLQGTDIHILHFIGHGGFDAGLQDGVLLFEDDAGRSREVTGGYLGVLLRNHPPLRLTVINACDGARTSRSDPFAGVAQSLVQQGLPAVIAMQFEISDEAARVFAGEFYRAVAGGYPVDAALVEARTALYVHQLGAEWGTPVLFMRAPDGRVFDVQPRATRIQELEDRTERKPWFHEQVVLVVAGLSLLASFVFIFLRPDRADSFAEILKAASRTPIGILSSCTLYFGAIAYVLSHITKFRRTWLGNTWANRLLVLAIFSSSLGYGFQIIDAAANARRFIEIALHAFDNKTMQGVADARITVTTYRSVNNKQPEVEHTVRSDEKIEGQTDSGGMFRGKLAVPSGPQYLTIIAESEGYQDYRQDKPLIQNVPFDISLVSTEIPRGISDHTATAPETFASTFQFTQPRFNLAASPQFNYGFSSLGLDTKVAGLRIQVKRVRVKLNVLTDTEQVCCDVWVLLGPHPFGTPTGAVVGGPNPFYVVPTTAAAPTQVRSVIGNSGLPYKQGSQATFWATYDFDTQKFEGYPNLDNQKDTFAPPMDLGDGLYAQVFVWDGNPFVRLDVEGISLTVEGVRQIGQR